MSFGGIFDLENQEKRLEEIERRSEDPDLWRDAAAAALVQRERSKLQRVVASFHGLEKSVNDAAALVDLAEADPDFASEVDSAIHSSTKVVEALELERMLGGPYDENDAIVSVNAGAGGTESQDWAEMLLRMLTRYTERCGFTLEMIDTQYGEEAGIKSATFVARGPYAYGYLKSEVGVHRLVRISPYDSQKRRHTSFASVGVTPEVDDTIAIEIKDEDLRVDTYRASGAGGQHVNKTDSAVRMTHIPTGVVVACQAERSQHKNRAKAMKLLRAKLFELEMQRQEAEKAKITGEKKKIEWGSQIRSYVLHPYRMVKDHRTGFEMGNADAVLDGELEGYVQAYLLGQVASPHGADDLD